VLDLTGSLPQLLDDRDEVLDLPKAIQTLDVPEKYQGYAELLRSL